MLKRPLGARGRLHREFFELPHLRGNRWDDPVERAVDVYLPPGYLDDPNQRFPVIYDLVGFTGSGLSHTSWRNFGLSVPERLDRLISTGQMPPLIAVFPDLFTALGGNQYIDSSAVGNYASAIRLDLVPAIDRRFRSLAEPAHRGLFGKSSGAYGALIHLMRYPETWGAAVAHSGDCAFDLCYLPDLALLLDHIAAHEQSIERFLAHIHSHEKISEREVHALMMLAMAASYDPDPNTSLGFHWPTDLHNGRIDWARWEKWRAHDPVVLVEQPAIQDNLRKARGLFIDCGKKDQYRLVYGARQLHQSLEAAGIAHIYQEFDDDHSNIDYRMDISLPWLAKTLS